MILTSVGHWHLEPIGWRVAGMEWKWTSGGPQWIQYTLHQRTALAKAQSVTGHAGLDKVMSSSSLLCLEQEIGDETVKISWVRMRRALRRAEGLGLHLRLIVTWCSS